MCFAELMQDLLSVVVESHQNGFCLGRGAYSKLNNKLLEMDKAETAYNLFKKSKMHVQLLMQGTIVVLMVGTPEHNQFVF